MNKQSILFAITTLCCLFLLSCSQFDEQTLNPASYWPPNEKLAEPLPIVSINNTEGVVLPISHIPAVLVQCSRPTLGLGDGYWMPKYKDIEELERNLPDYVTTDPHRPNQRINLNQYRRQYAGVIRNGRKMIYVNLFIVYRGPELVDWRKQVIVVCDGGSAFFGVEYDVTSGEFTHIAFNGII